MIMRMSSRMAPPMEGTHTTLYLRWPIRERSRISLYAPSGRGRGFIYKGRDPPHAPSNESCEQRGEGPAAQRGGTCETAAVVRRGNTTVINFLTTQHHSDQRAGVTMGKKGAEFPGQNGRSNRDALSSRSSQRSIVWALQAPKHQFRGPQQGKQWAERTTEGEVSSQREGGSLDNAEISQTQPVSSWPTATSLEMLGFESQLYVPGSGSVCNELCTSRQGHSLLDTRTCGSSADQSGELSEYDSELFLQLGMPFSPLEADPEGCSLSEQRGKGAAGVSAEAKQQELLSTPRLHASTPTGSQKDEGEEPLAWEWEEALPALGEALACSLYGELLMESLGEYGEWEDGHWSPLLEGSSLGSSSPDLPLSATAESPGLPTDTPSASPPPPMPTSLGCGQSRSPLPFSSPDRWRNASPFSAPLCSQLSQRVLLLHPSEEEEEEEVRDGGAASPAEGAGETEVPISSKSSSERASPTLGAPVRNISSSARGR
ncbi:uncharacterized protein LOC118230195 [Anguilla anguilla]|uniref:uncharacterized protein LOC118230195 n=1 Tax=Anguilla anguilla TaxID=7936 RepID=UPI0015B23499|nr:uncharacterized protein LOC118230195 [Anguilla anguilla]